MEKVKIKLATLGYIPARFDIKKVKHWKSELFEISIIDIHNLNCESDIDYYWVYSYGLINWQVTEKDYSDYLVVLTNVPLENNWYSRRLGGNKIAFTFHEIKDHLLYDSIPLENVIYRILYAYSLVYLRSGRRIPNHEETPGFTHDETKGCLFDMNGIKSVLIESCNKPIICKECEHTLASAKVPINLTENIKLELKMIKKHYITDG